MTYYIPSDDYQLQQTNVQSTPQPSPSYNNYQQQPNRHHQHHNHYQYHQEVSPEIVQTYKSQRTQSQSTHSQSQQQQQLPVIVYNTRHQAHKPYSSKIPANYDTVSSNQSSIHQ